MRTYDQWLTNDGPEPDDDCTCADDKALFCPVHDEPEEDDDNTNYG